jgi:catechol 2,3-dioxygenase-like lactoylglutathione lyase family enzyme|tara:strand:+ start:63 stop:482 length:420 start_codon:yes stop_codon:yes gene_type:complete
MIETLRHLGIVVRDMDKSLKFYKYLGYEVVSDMKEDSKFIDKILGLNDSDLRTVKMIHSDNHMIELLHYTNPVSDDNLKRVNFVGCSHFALSVSNIESLYEDLSKNNVEFISKPISNGKVKVAFCKDPNDVYLELVEEL